MTAQECARLLRGGDDFIIISHRRPDGDTVGSCAALCSAMRRAGKSAWCFRNPEITDNQRPFIAPYFAPEGVFPSLAVTVDVADEQLFPDGAPTEIALAIDHHPTNTRFAKYLCLAPERSSCGELMLEIIKALCGSVTREEANLLYMAVTTDTGCFQYANTNAATLRAAAELIDLGAESVKLTTKLFRTTSRARLLLEGRMLAGLRFFRDGAISVAVVTLAMLEECGANENDCEDLAGLAGRAAGNRVSVTIRETAPGVSKVSMRCAPSIDVSVVCAEFGGGGHKMASGCTVKLPPDEALGVIVEAMERHWPEGA